MYKEPLRSDSLRRQRHIVDCFARLLEATPYPGLTVRQVCTAAGISRTVFYRYFESKEDLADALAGAGTAGGRLCHAVRPGAHRPLSDFQHDGPLGAHRPGGDARKHGRLLQRLSSPAAAGKLKGMPHHPPAAPARHGAMESGGFTKSPRRVFRLCRNGRRAVTGRRRPGSSWPPGGRAFWRALPASGSR